MASVDQRTAPPPAKPEGGLRARNKAEKLRRIRHAARALFVEKGYDDTTTREIARRAGVGLGTLFTYAADKRDLLFLIFNDELEQVAATAFGQIRPDAPFVEQLIGIFREFYAFFAEQPRLARFMLRELTFYVAGSEARRFQGHREQILAQLAKTVAKAKRDRKIGSNESSAVIAWAIFSIYAAEVRRWLGDDDAPDPARGLAALRRLFDLLLAGL